MNFILAATEPASTVRNALTTLDWCVVAGYFLLLFGLAWWIILKSRNTTKDYFLAGNSLSWFIVGASIFASNIGSEHLVGLAGSGCTDGVKMAHFELHAWCLLVLAWVFIPFFIRSKVYTMPEFLEKRFSPGSRWFLSLISLVAYVVTKIAVGIFAGGVVFSVLLPEFNLFGLDSFWVGSILVIVLTGLYTALGGMRAVAYTEALQTLILVLGSVFVTVYGINELGKYSVQDNGTIVKNEERGSFFAGCKNLRTVCDNEKEGRDMFNLWMSIKPENVDKLTWKPVIEREYNEAGEETGQIKTQAWYFKDRTQGSFYPWIGMLLCAPIVGLWYWCTDQYIVQRALAAKNETEARRGSIFAAFLKLLPVFIFIIPGMVCFALAYHEAHKEIAQTGKVIVDEEKEIVDLTDIVNVTFSEKPEVDSMGNIYVKADLKDCQGAFPLMVREVLPVGLRGLVVAGLLSALMSSLAGVFNASATLFTMDFYHRFDKNASEAKLVWIGRVATAVMVLIGLAWIPIIQGKHGLYDYLQSVQGYLAPPIFAVFLLGVFMKRMNAKGALTALILGFGLGLLRLGVDTFATLGTNYAEGSFCWFINNVYFQYYSLFIFIVCILSMIGVSYATAAPDYEKIQGLSFGSTTAEERAASRSSWSWFDVIASCVVMCCIIAAYIYFAG